VVVAESAVLIPALQAAGFRVLVADNGLMAAGLLRTEQPSAIIAAIKTPGLAQLLPGATQHHPPVPLLLLGQTASVDEAVGAMQQGAADFLPAPLQIDVLLLRLRRLLEKARPPEAQPGLSTEVQNYLGLVGSSAAMRTLLATLQKISRYKSNVLLLGESGTGKELVARGIHALGPRRSKVFVPINCATLGKEILENELFGHERGAYTGANERKKGLFELADEGTLFLDEIGEMDPSTQAKLLRVLERNEFRRVGGTEKIRVDLSVVAATNRNLEHALESGRFRSDLYYRLKVVTIVVPPLREHREDIPALVDHFIEDFNRRHGGKIRGVAPQLLRRLMEHTWPGNVRELKNAVESACVLASGDTLEFDPLADVALTSRPAPVDATELRFKIGTRLDDVEKALTLATVQHSATRAEAARKLGIGLRTLHAKLRSYGF